MESIGGGNCGCGRPGTCYEDFQCGCSIDHGDLRPCELHENAERCPVCQNWVYEVHPTHNVWVHDECWGEYVATRAEYYGANE